SNECSNDVSSLLRHGSSLVPRYCTTGCVGFGLLEALSVYSDMATPQALRAFAKP
ncbi:hypothetical protein Tco_1512172, partial [Tanacetum coccineum]